MTDAQAVSLSALRYDVITAYKNNGWAATTPANFQAIFASWWGLNRASTGDPSASYSTLDAYAAAATGIAGTSQSVGVSSGGSTSGATPGSSPGIPATATLGGATGAGIGQFATWYTDKLQTDPFGTVVLTAVVGLAVMVGIKKAGGS